MIQISLQNNSARFQGCDHSGAPLLRAQARIRMTAQMYLRRLSVRKADSGRQLDGRGFDGDRSATLKS
jgi:hypothetical protein